MRQTKTGILLANLGTPDAPTPEAVKRYLKQFLSDRRVVDTSRLLWWPLLRGVILPLRSPRVAKLYASVWMEGGSPLMVYSHQQQQALAQRLPETPVALGIILMHWRTAYVLLLPNMANRICCCSLIMAFPSVMQMKAMITRNVAAQQLANSLPHWRWHRKK